MTTRNRILNCALEELDAKGLSGLSLRAVGQRAGITPMAVYRHFADKDDLLQALGAHALSEWQARVQVIKAETSRLWFDAVGMAFIDFALETPALFDAAFVLKTKAERVYPEDFVAGRSPVISSLTDWLAQGQIQGWVRAGNPLEMAMSVWGLLQGLVGLHRSGRFNMSRADFTALCLRAAHRLYEKEVQCSGG